MPATPSPLLGAGGMERTSWLLVAAVVVVWFLALGARHLLPTDEGRYAEISREMFVSGDWVTVRYNDLKYFEKPPFHMWMTALAYHAFGVGEWQARLWAGISGALGLLLTAWSARAWFGARAGLLTGLVLLAAPMWNMGSHFNSLDISVAAALACVLAGMLMAQHPQQPHGARRAWMWFAWGAVGVAVLTKGLIGLVLPGLALVVYTLVARDWSVWRRLHLVSGALLMLAITAPWFVLVSLRNPEFAQFFFIHEHWQRYTSTVHHRSAPAWYFVPLLVAGFLPWLGLSMRAAAVVREDDGAHGFKPRLLLAVWAVAIFLFFSASGSKLPGYILPMFPALAVLAALALDKMDAAVWNRQILGALVVAVAGLLASPLVSQLGSDSVPAELYRAFALWLAAACVIATAGFAFARHLNQRGHGLRSRLVFGLSMFAATTVGLAGHNHLGRNSAGIALVAPLQAVLTPDMPVHAVRLLDHTLPFYLGRTTVLVESPDELEFGTRQEPQKWVPTLAAFQRQWSSGPPAVAIMTHDTFALLRSQNLVMFPIAETPRRVAVANFLKAPQ